MNILDYFDSSDYYCEPGYPGDTGDPGPRGGPGNKGLKGIKGDLCLSRSRKNRVVQYMNQHHHNYTGIPVTYRLPRGM